MFVYLCLMRRPTTRSTRTDTRLPTTTLFRSADPDGAARHDRSQPFSRCAGEGLVFAAQEKAGFRVLRRGGDVALLPFTGEGARGADEGSERSEIGRAPCREGVCQYV